MARPRSRREMVVASSAAAFAIASCGGGSKAKPADTVSTTEAQSDAAVLDALLDQEHSSIAAYMLIATRLRGPELASARHFEMHERRHADALARAISKLGATPNPPQPDAEYARGFPRLRGR